MTATLLPVLKARFIDNNNEPLTGGKVYTYASGTLTPKTSYTDATGATANSNPVILNAYGEADIWISGNYTINVTDANDVQQQGYPIDGVQDIHTADNVTATSTTSLSVSAASKTFTTQANKYFPVGIFLLIVSDAAPSTNWMHGQVTAYSGTQLTINVTTSTGSGTHSDWTISLSGPVGPTGSAGAPGAGTGDVVGPAGATASRIALFDGATGKLIKQHTGGAGSAASLDVGTSANQVVQLTAAAKLPAVDGSLLTGLNLAVLTTGDAGKIVMGTITIQWGRIAAATTSNSGSVTFGTAFSSAPNCIIVSEKYSSGSLGNSNLQWNGESTTGFTWYKSASNSQIFWIAIGPT